MSASKLSFLDCCDAEDRGMDFLSQLSASQKNLNNLATRERLAFASTKKRKSHIITTDAGDVDEDLFREFNIEDDEEVLLPTLAATSPAALPAALPAPLPSKPSLSGGSQHSGMAVAGSVKPASAASVGAAAQDPAHPTACQEGEPQVPEPGALSSAHSAEVCPGNLATEAGAETSLSGAEKQAEDNASAPGAPAGHELAAATGSQERRDEQCKGKSTNESALPSHKAASMAGMPAIPAAELGKDMQPGTTCMPLQAAAQPSDPAAIHTGVDAAAQLVEDTDMPHSQAAASREVHMEEPALAVTETADAAQVDRDPVTPEKAGMVMNTALKAPAMAAEGGQVADDRTVAADEAATGAKQTAGAEGPTQLAGLPMQPIDGAAACAAQTAGNTGAEEPMQLASLCCKPTQAADSATACAEQTAGKPVAEESMQLASLCLKTTQLIDGAAACIEQTPAKNGSEDPMHLASLCRKPTQATGYTVMPHSEGAFGSPLAAPLAETQLVLRPLRSGHAAREHPHTGQAKAAACVGVPASSGPNSGPVLKPAPIATSVLTGALGKRLVSSTSRATGGWFGGSSSNPYATPKPRGATLGSLPRSHAPAQSDTLLATRATSLCPAAASPVVCTPAQTSAGVTSLNVAASPKTAPALGMASNAAPLAKQAAANSAGMASSTLASCTKAHSMLQRAGPTASSLPGHAPAPPAAPQTSHPAVDISKTAADGQPVAGSCMLPPQPHKPTQAPGTIPAAAAPGAPRTSSGGREKAAQDRGAGLEKVLDAAGAASMTAGKSGAGPEPMDTACAQELVAHTKLLEDMLFSMQQLNDEALGLRVALAITGNRLARLDSPMASKALHDWAAQAHALLTEE